MGDIWPVLWNLLEIILQNIINIDKIVIFLVQQCSQSSMKILVLIDTQVIQVTFSHSGKNIWTWSKKNEIEITDVIN